MHAAINRGLILVVWAALQAQPVYAWGNVGHWLTARIAELNLTDRSKAGVAALLAQDKADPNQSICGQTPVVAPAFLQPKSIVDVAVYPDFIKKLPVGDGTGAWHFTSINHDDSGSTFSFATVCVGKFAPSFAFDAANNCYTKLPPNPQPLARLGNCSLSKIEEFFLTIADGSAVPADRVLALKFLVHLVGDSHQPLHNAEWNKDIGGNARGVSFLQELDSSFGPLNLHTLWDDTILERSIRQHQFGDANTPHILDANDKETYAQFLYQSAKDQPVAEWLAIGPTEWGYEAQQVAVLHAYKGFTHDFTPIPYPYIIGMPVSRVTLGDDYFNENGPIVDKQVLKGGLRLAGLLNAAFE